MVAATEQAWRWIDRLGVPGPNPAGPLPPHLYVLATHVTAWPERRPARVRGRPADGTWQSSGPRRLPLGLRSRQAAPSPWRPPQSTAAHRCSAGLEAHPP